MFHHVVGSIFSSYNTRGLHQKNWSWATSLEECEKQSNEYPTLMDDMDSSSLAAHFLRGSEEGSNGCLIYTELANVLLFWHWWWLQVRGSNGFRRLGCKATTAFHSYLVIALAPLAITTTYLRTWYHMFHHVVGSSFTFYNGRGQHQKSRSWATTLGVCAKQSKKHPTLMDGTRVVCVLGGSEDSNGCTSSQSLSCSGTGLAQTVVSKVRGSIDT